MKNEFFVILFAFFTAPLMSQVDDIPVNVGYLAPYGLQYGVKGGVSFPIKSWELSSVDEAPKERYLNMSPQIGYFINPNVQRNLLLEAALDYKWYKEGRKIHFITSIGLGYLLATKMEDGTVNLGSGNIDNVGTTNVHSFLPTFNAGIGKDPVKSLGYYAKAFYGRKFAAQVEDAAFFGLELGLVFNLFSKTSN